MGLFVLTASDSVIDRLKAALANLRLEERLLGDQRSYLVSDFAIPYLESVIKDLEEDSEVERPRPDWIPKHVQLPKTTRITTEGVDPLYLKNIQEGKHLSSVGISDKDIKEAKKRSKKNSINPSLQVTLAICTDCGNYHCHSTKQYTVSLCKSCEDDRLGLEIDE